MPDGGIKRCYDPSVCFPVRPAVRLSVCRMPLAQDGVFQDCGTL